tara:strand:+ start:1899 stop:2063 length:165 start_codon:yes stop_codon:yes gene_type:complete
MATTNELDVRLTSHEAVCELRYESISARLKRIEQIGITVAGFIIALLIHIILKA